VEALRELSQVVKKFCVEMVEPAPVVVVCAEDVVPVARVNGREKALAVEETAGKPSQ
jgi:hypothetical protein